MAEGDCEAAADLKRRLDAMREECDPETRKNMDNLRNIVRNQPDNTNWQIFFDGVFKSLLLHFTDRIEYLREVAADILMMFVTKVPDLKNHLPYIMETLHQRLGGKEMCEPSEEVRFLLASVLDVLVSKCGEQNLAAHVPEIVEILANLIVDPYPEVKKIGCACAANLAKTVPEKFFYRSEALINPLLQTVSHQHNKVRVCCIKAIGSVVHYGNNKHVEDVVSHLAQRFFDQNPSVRLEVTKVIGKWLLELPDRYSFFHKLIPLLLTSISDESPDVSTTAQSLWTDVGKQYTQENEKDFKDELDFPAVQPSHYPPSVLRPNVGCRELTYRNISKILPALLRDLQDWVVETRIKAAQLLYMVILNVEKNATQYLEKILTGITQNIGDDEPLVVKYVREAATLVGYFIDPETYCQLILPAIQSNPTTNALATLAAILEGSERTALKSCLVQICDLLVDDDVCHNLKQEYQEQLQKCIAAIISVCAEDCAGVSQQLFVCLLTSHALSQEKTLKSHSLELIENLRKATDMSTLNDLYEKHSKYLLERFQQNKDAWSAVTPNCLIFEALMSQAGGAIATCLKEIIPLLVANLHPEKEPELRLKFFIVLSNLMVRDEEILDALKQDGESVSEIVTGMIVPNLVWRAGRTATALRTAAISCLWAVFHSGLLGESNTVALFDKFHCHVIGLLDDEAKKTRALATKVLQKAYFHGGNSIPVDDLHKAYPELLKQLDDTCSDVRHSSVQTIVLLCQCFPDDYDVEVNRVHLESIFDVMLVHLDDSDHKMQQIVLDALMEIGKVDGDLLLEKVGTVRHRHRHPENCDSLAHYLCNLSLKSSDTGDS